MKYIISTSLSLAIVWCAMRSGEWAFAGNATLSFTHAVAALGLIGVLSYVFYMGGYDDGVADGKKALEDEKREH